MSKKNKRKKQNQPVRKATTPLSQPEKPAVQFVAPQMTDQRIEKRFKPIFAVELVLGVVLIGSWVVLLLLRTCQWDFFLLVIWAIVIVAAAIWLFLAERKLRCEKEKRGAGHRA